MRAAFARRSQLGYLPAACCDWSMVLDCRHDKYHYHEGGKNQAHDDDRRHQQSVTGSLPVSLIA